VDKATAGVLDATAFDAFDEGAIARFVGDKRLMIFLSLDCHWTCITSAQTVLLVLVFVIAVRG